MMINHQPAPGPRLVIPVSAHDQLPPIDDVWQIARQPVFHDEVGRMLFRALLTGDRRAQFAAALQAVAESGAVLTLDLRFDRAALHLARYPWELLHDGTRFLLADQSVNVVRSVPFAAPALDSGVDRTLEVLLAEVIPPALLPEYDRLQATLDPALRAGRLDLAYLMPPTWEALMDWLLAGAPDVLHVAGRGVIPEDAAQSGPIFEGADGGPDAVSARSLGDALFCTRLRLLVLSATARARGVGESEWGAAAPALIAAGIPAVVAMQQPMSEAAMQRFALGFYAALLAGRSVETAVQIGRGQLARSTFWHIPALTLRAAITPDPTYALREVWIDTAAPQAVPVHGSFRLGVWVRASGSAPDAEAVRRLVGCPVNAGDSSGQAAQPVPVIKALQPGPVTIRVSASGAEVHVRKRRTALWPREMLPPVWVPITPRQTGRLTIQVELVQDDSVVAVVTHGVQVVVDDPGAPSARVQSRRFPASPERQSGDFDSVDYLLADDRLEAGDYAASETERPYQLPAIDSPAPPRLAAVDHEREPVRESRQREPETDRRRAAVMPDAAQSEPLDGVLDWLQAGEQPVREKDDPLIGSDEFVPHEEDYASFPVGEVDAPTIAHVLEPDLADRTLAGGNWARSGLDDAQLMPGAVPDDAQAPPTIIGGMEFEDDLTLLLGAPENEERLTDE